MFFRAAFTILVASPGTSLGCAGTLGYVDDPMTVYDPSGYSIAPPEPDRVSMEVPEGPLLERLWPKGSQFE